MNTRYIKEYFYAEKAVKMLIQRHTWLTRFSIVWCLSLLPGLSLQAGQQYNFGVVPQYEIRKITKIWQPILNEVEKRTGIKLNLVGSPSIPAFEKSFGQGEYDFAYMNPYHALVAHQQQQYRPVLRDIGRELYGIIVVRKDSPITELKHLDGKIVAFPAPNALGAALIPRTEFAKKFNITIKPKYVKSHSSVYLNVLLGQAAAGGGVQKTFEKQSAELKEQLRVLYETARVPPHPIVAHSRVNEKDIEKIQQAILDIGNTKEGKAWLSKIPVKKIGKASLDDYLPLGEMGLEEFYVK